MEEIKGEMVTKNIEERIICERVGEREKKSEKAKTEAITSCAIPL